MDASLTQLCSGVFGSHTSRFSLRRNRSIAVVVMAFCILNGAAANALDELQLTRWSILLRLSTALEQIHGCLLDSIGNGTSEQTARIHAYYITGSDVLGTAVMKYVVDYVGTRDDDESPAAFSYRVWSVVVLTGAERSGAGSLIDCEKFSR